MLNWLQAGYTQEEIDVYGVGEGGEEVVVVHKVWRYSLLHDIARLTGKW